MNLRQIAEEALHLPREERSQLIQQLISSIESPSEDELKADWTLEAQHREKQLDDGSVQAIPGDEVMEKARNLAG